MQDVAEKEGFFDMLLGSNCYSRSVSRLNRDCNAMDQEHKSRLALHLVNCQMALHGSTQYACGDRQPLKECTEGMPDRVWTMYVEFLTHVQR